MIRVISPASNEILFMIANPDQKIEGLKNDLINVFSKKSETILPDSVMLTDKDGFELLDEDTVELLEKNDLVKIVPKTVVVENAPDNMDFVKVQEKKSEEQQQPETGNFKEL